MRQDITEECFPGDKLHNSLHGKKLDEKGLVINAMTYDTVANMEVSDLSEARQVPPLRCLSRPTPTHTLSLAVSLAHTRISHTTPPQLPGGR